MSLARSWLIQHPVSRPAFWPCHLFLRSRGCSQPLVTKACFLPQFQPVGISLVFPASVPDYFSWDISFLTGWGSTLALLCVSSVTEYLFLSPVAMLLNFSDTTGLAHISLYYLLSYHRSDLSQDYRERHCFPGRFPTACYRHLPCQQL